MEIYIRVLKTKTSIKNPVAQKKAACDDIKYKYLQQKIEYHRNKSNILFKYNIKNYKAFKKTYRN